MTADLTDAAEKRLAEAAQPRDELLAQLAAARPFPGRYRVVRQFTHIDEELIVSSHRFALVAEWHARRWEKRHRAQPTSCHYTVRRADS